MADKVEDILGYSFKERSFLLQALTHASYTRNDLTESYERLEFLGDAVLDYLVTAHIFSSSREDAKPGQMTDCRSALVNNNLLAALVANANLHPFLLHHSPELMQKVGQFGKVYPMSRSLPLLMRGRRVAKILRTSLARSMRMRLSAR